MCARTRVCACVCVCDSVLHFGALLFSLYYGVSSELRTGHCLQNWRILLVGNLGRSFLKGG